ncbi:MAG TPA: hypothetical protein VLM38_22620, partial [Blastocatellia bacterium]|nr:hypothetical protein [Blastocatellia bacterium]
MDTQFRRFFGVVPRTVSALPAVLIALVSVGYGGQEREVRWRPPEIALDIILPELPQPRVRFAGGGLIRRESLKIIDPTAAGDFTAVDVQARAEGDSMTVRLSIIYNDISNQEWWKDKKERVVGTWVIQRGESVSPSELAAFGIEPFELKVIDAKPVVF